jgi:hypothetical protein
MDQFKPGIYTARDSKKIKYNGEDEGSWMSSYSFVSPEDFEKVASTLKSGKTGDRPIYTKLKKQHKDIWDSIQKNFGIKEESFSIHDSIIEIQEEVVIEQDGKKIILEKGDKIQVLEKDLKEYIGQMKGPQDRDLDKFFDEFKYRFIDSLQVQKSLSYLLDVYGPNNNLSPIDLYKLFFNFSNSIKKHYL